VFESAEEKAAKKQARAEDQARVEAAAAARHRAAADERAHSAWLASPLGRATAAKQAGHEFFELQLDVGGHTGTASFGTAGGTRETTSSAQTLAELEKVGWRLEHAGYVFLMTGESSTNRGGFSSGENTAVSGTVVGIYLFRNDRTVEAPADAG
jgi:hypothetical protein